MYNMQAIVRRNISNATLQYERLGYIANNMANYSTVGYKNVSFEQVLREDGYIDGVIRTNVARGAMRASFNPYDVAINGVGYIPVVSPDGEIQYTRDGSFSRGENGYLITADGWLVGDGIKIPANTYKLEIKPNGEVFSYDDAGSLPEKIGTIPVVQFDCPEALEQGNNNKMIATEESGQPYIMKKDQNIKQYATEVSNTNIYDEVNNLMRLNTSVIASLNLMRVADDMYNKGINIREG